MSSFDCLPVVLVSAKTKADASHIISEIVDNEPVDIKPAGSGSDERVWRIINKYYEADVRLRPRADADSPDGDNVDNTVEAHVIYLTEDEVTVEVAERRYVGGAGAAVCVLAAEAARLPAALGGWAARRRAEPVALREPPPSPDADEGPPEPHGVTAARAALHAHVWPRLRRIGAPALPLLSFDDTGSESSDGGGRSEDSEWEGEGEGEGAVEGAERFAAALGGLGGGARAAAALSGPERRAAAEALVAAFARALGHDLDAL